MESKAEEEDHKEFCILLRHRVKEVVFIATWDETYRLIPGEVPGPYYFRFSLERARETTKDCSISAIRFARKPTFQEINLVTEARAKTGNNLKPWVPEQGLTTGHSQLLGQTTSLWGSIAHSTLVFMMTSLHLGPRE